MSVVVKLIGAKPDSEEYRCALILKNKFESELPNSILGEIILHANATVVGQSVKDVDLLMIGTLDNCTMNLSYTDKAGLLKSGQIEIKSFCTAIEIKSHSSSGIFREGTEFYVKYSEGNHSVTSQSNEQKVSVMNFFKRMVNDSPFVTNLIWFSEVPRNDINDLLTVDGGIMPSNVFGHDFSINDLMQLLVWQKTPSFYRGKYHLDSGFYGKSVFDLNRVFNALAVAKKTMGTLTRRRIEQISAKSLSSKISEVITNKMTIYRGKAGCGKTVGLLNKAIYYVDEEDARVLFLTYNKALVADIRRLLTLSEMPDMFQTSCLHITTMHAYFYDVINSCLYNSCLDGEKFIQDYSLYLGELLDFIKSDKDNLELILDTMKSKVSLNWDICMIDEAQDWTPLERDIVIAIFTAEKIIVADGGRQFVRNIDICDWTEVPERKSIKLKQCLRQKNNLVKFLNCCLLKYGKQDQEIVSGDNIPGGKIIIVRDNSAMMSIVKEELNQLKQSGNIEYDMLVLTPHDLVERTGQGFKLKNKFELNDICVWDGTKEEVRSNFDPFGDSVRVLQYESSRGLEAWTTVCIDFDEFIMQKMNTYDDAGVVDSLLLESKEERKIKYMINWMLIPLTRAIDTIVITLRNQSYPISKVLLAVAKENPDYILIK